MSPSPPSHPPTIERWSVRIMMMINDCDRGRKRVEGEVGKEKVCTALQTITHMRATTTGYNVSVLKSMIPPLRISLLFLLFWLST